MFSSTNFEVSDGIVNVLAVEIISVCTLSFFARTGHELSASSLWKIRDPESYRVANWILHKLVCVKYIITHLEKTRNAGEWAHSTYP